MLLSDILPEIIKWLENYSAVRTYPHPTTTWPFYVGIDTCGFSVGLAHNPPQILPLILFGWTMNITSYISSPSPSTSFTAVAPIRVPSRARTVAWPWAHGNARVVYLLLCYLGDGWFATIYNNNNKMTTRRLISRRWPCVAQADVDFNIQAFAYAREHSTLIWWAGGLLFCSRREIRWRYTSI